MLRFCGLGFRVRGLGFFVVTPVRCGLFMGRPFRGKTTFPWKPFLFVATPAATELQRECVYRVRDNVCIQ